MGLGVEQNCPGLSSQVNPSPPAQSPLLLGAPASTHLLLALFLLPACIAVSWPSLPGAGCTPTPSNQPLCPEPLPVHLPPLLHLRFCVCDSPPLLFKAACFIHHRQQFIFPGESFAWFH